MQPTDHTHIPGPVLEQLALDDYRRHVGERVYVCRLCVGTPAGDSYRWLSHPARVMVCHTPPEMVAHWDCKDILSSVWNVELIGRHPDIPADATLSIYGKGYTTLGGVFRGDFVAAWQRHSFTRTSKFGRAARQFALAPIAAWRHLSQIA